MLNISSIVRSAVKQAVDVKVDQMLQTAAVDIDVVVGTQAVRVAPGTMFEVMSVCGAYYVMSQGVAVAFFKETRFWSKTFECRNAAMRYCSHCNSKFYGGGIAPFYIRWV